MQDELKLWKSKWFGRTTKKTPQLFFNKNYYFFKVSAHCATMKINFLCTCNGLRLSLNAAVTKPVSGSHISLTMVTAPGISNFSNLCFFPCWTNSRSTAPVRSLSVHCDSKSRLALSNFSAKVLKCCNIQKKFFWGFFFGEHEFKIRNKLK